MHIAIEARALSATGGGVRTYTYELIRHLLPLSDGDSYTLMYDSAKPMGTFPQAHEQVLSVYHEAFMPLWLQRRVPAYLKKLQPMLAHFTKADVPRRKILPTVVTIYDSIPLLFPESQSLARRLYWPHALHRAARYSDHIITISQVSKRDIINRFQISPDNITVTPLAVDTRRFHPMPDYAAAPTPYILFVGTRDNRKNVAALVRAFAQIADQIPHQLWITGGHALKQDHAAAVVQQLSLEKRVRFLDFVPDDALPALYAKADLFVYPSVYEGWGFPPQEAMASGTPVIVSDGGALPEVVGDAGEIVSFTVSNLVDRTRDHDFEKKLAQTMLVVLMNPGKQTHMRRAGLNRVRDFTWQVVAELTRRVYSEVV